MQSFLGLVCVVLLLLVACILLRLHGDQYSGIIDSDGIKESYQENAIIQTAVIHTSPELLHACQGFSDMYGCKNGVKLRNSETDPA